MREMFNNDFIVLVFNVFKAIAEQQGVHFFVEMNGIPIEILHEGDGNFISLDN